MDETSQEETPAEGDNTSKSTASQKIEKTEAAQEDTAKTDDMKSRRKEPAKESSVKTSNKDSGNAKKEVWTPPDVQLGVPKTEERNKSPITVQQWIDSLPLDDPNRISRKDDDSTPGHEDQSDSEVENLTLGAEASVVCPPAPLASLPAIAVVGCGGSDTGSHCSSMESFLEARKPDAEQILLELGFGGSSNQPDVSNRIPKRFLQPSKLKGIDLNNFLQQQREMADTANSSFNGYRGLSGRSHERPSVIVGKIMERLRESECANRRTGFDSPHRLSPRLASIARGLVHQIRAARSEGGGSVLSANNRKWLRNQGDKSPEPLGRRLVIGNQTFVLSRDGQLIPAPLPQKPESSETPKEDDTVENGSKEDEEGENSESSCKNEDSPPSQSNSESNQEDLQEEYRIMCALLRQLAPIDDCCGLKSFETFSSLDEKERYVVKVWLVETGLDVYVKRIDSLQVAPSMRELLVGHADKLIAAIQAGPQPLELFAQQLTSLLEHQAKLLLDLDGCVKSNLAMSS